MSRNTTIRIGAIGCGGRLRHILRLLLNQDRRLRLTAAHDPFPPSLDALAEIVDEPFARVGDWRSVINDPDVDWVMIGSPNRFHAEHAIAALEAGKDVFCEKPLATDFTDCLRVRDAVQRTGRHFVFGLVLRYSPHYQRIRALLDEGQIGELISFEFNETLNFNHGGYIFGNWRRSAAEAGSHILEKTCHDLDLSNWMVGSLPVRVASFGGRRYFIPENAHLAKRIGPDAKGQPAFQGWPDPQRIDPFSDGADILDHQVVILEYANGVCATFHTNAATALPERRFYLSGTEGAVRADAQTGNITFKRIGHDTVAQEIDSGVAGGHAGGDEVMVASLRETMLSDAAPLAGIQEALQSAIVAFAIDEAVASGRVVDLRRQWERAGVPLFTSDTHTDEGRIAQTVQAVAG